MAQTIQRGLTREADFQALINALPSDIEMVWGEGLSSQSVREQEPFKSIFEFLTDVSDNVNQFATLANAVIDILSTAIDVLSAVIGIGVDVLEGFFLAVKLLAEQVRQIFDGTSISGLMHTPFEPKTRRKPSEVLYDVGMAYLDEGDILRPIAPTRTNYAISIVALYSLPNVDALVGHFNQIMSSIVGSNNSVASSLSDIVKPPATKATYRDNSFKLNGTSGMAPDWAFNKSLSSFSFVHDMLLGLDEMLRSMAPKRTYAEKINANINTLRLRVNRVQALVSKVLATYTAMTSLFALGDSNAVFVVKGTGNSQDFAKAIINAPNHPDYPKADLNERSYSNFGNYTDNVRSLGESAMFSGAFAIHLQAGASATSLELLENLINAIFVPTGKTVTNSSDASRYGNQAEVTVLRDAAGNIKSANKQFENARKTINQGLGG